MNILIISQAFSPSHVIGAIRPSKLAKYFNGDNNVTVITSEQPSLGTDDILLKDQENYGDIIKLPNNIYGNISKFLRKRLIVLSNEIPTKVIVNTTNDITNKKRVRSIILNQRKNILLNLKTSEEKNWAKVCINYANENFTSKQFDVVFTSYSSASNLIVGKKIKEAGFAKKWIADFRDPMIPQNLLLRENSTYFKLQNEVVIKADLISTVSKGIKNYLEEHINFYNLKVDKSKIKVVYNGYDLDDYNNINIHDNNQNKYKIVYTGGLYNGRRNLTPLFRALQKLRNEKNEVFNNIEFHYAGGEGDLVNFWANEYEISSILQNHGEISRGKSLSLQASAHKVVILTWNGKEKYKQGVLPGKIYETMPLNCKLLCLVHNESEDKSELNDIVTKFNLGKTYNTYYNSMNEVIDNIYIDLVNDINLEYNNLNNKKIDEFNYKNISSKFTNFIVNI